MKKNVLILLLTMLSSGVFSQDGFIQGSFSDLFVNTFAVADFNGDGYDDVFGIDLRFSHPSDAYLLLNNADGAIGFDVSLLEAENGALGGCAAGDYDGDGDMDVVLSKGDNADLYIMTNDGSAAFEAVALGVSGATNFQFRDVEGDGDLDIVGVNYDLGTLYVYVNAGDQTYSTTTLSTNTTGLWSFDSGDIDGDGDVDMLAGFNTYNGKQVVAYRNDGSNNFEEVVIMENDYDNLRDVLLVDVNDDGMMDLAAINQSKFTAWMNQGDFSFEKMDLANYPGGASFFANLIVGDFNGDGVADPVMATTEGIVWYPNTCTDPVSYDRQEVGGVATAYNMATADFDNDGDMDLLVSNGDLWWYENMVMQVATETIPENTFQIALFPNPASEVIHIRSKDASNPEITSFTITDEQGRVLLEDHRPVVIDKGAGLEVNVRHLPRGYYIFSAVTASGEAVKLGFLRE